MYLTVQSTAQLAINLYDFKNINEQPDYSACIEGYTLFQNGRWNIYRCPCIPGEALMTTSTENMNDSAIGGSVL